MTDPDIQRAVDTAARELARRIRANPAPADPDALAAAYVRDLCAEGWRPIPRPQPIQSRPAGDPPSAEWRAAADRIRSRTEAAAEAAQ